MRRHTLHAKLLGLVPVWAVSFLFLLPPVLSAQKAAAPSAEPVPSEVETSARLSKQVIPTGEVTRFWLTIRNRSARSISNVQLEELEAPGFQVQSLSWYAGDAHSCWSTGRSPRSPVPDCKVLAAELQPGQSITVWGDLEASEVQHGSSVTAIVAWTSANKIPSSLWVSLGQPEIQSEWQPFLSVLQILYNLVKDLALPIVLLVIGWLIQRWDKNREAAREEQEQRKAQLTQTWNSMLPQSHRLATRHYMPVQSAVAFVLKYLGEYQAAQPGGEDGRRQASRRAFYYVALLERRFRHMANTVGGYYFKDRVGEELASNCGDSYRELFLWRDETILKSFSALLNHMEVNEPFASFLDKLDTTDVPGVSEAFRQAWQCFEKWLESGEYNETLPYLKAYSSLMAYEMNRPYEYWYGRKERLELDEEDEKLLRKVAAKIASTPGRERFVQETEEYLKEGKNPTAHPASSA